MNYKNLVVATETFVSCCQGDLIEREVLYKKTILGNYRDLNTGSVLKPRKFVEHPLHVRLMFPSGGQGEYNLTNFRPFAEEFGLSQNARGTRNDAKKMFLAKYPDTQFKRTSAADNRARFEK